MNKNSSDDLQDDYERQIKDLEQEEKNNSKNFDFYCHLFGGFILFFLLIYVLSYVK